MILWDIKTQQKNKINELVVKMYLCGPTVYNDVHIGNIRPVIIFDIIQRIFKFTNQEYFYVQNITDIDDKIINQAQLEAISETALAEKYTANYLKLFKQLKLNEPQQFVKVTDNIAGIIDFIQKLIEKEAAYIKAGNVYFATEKYRNVYSELAKQNLESLQIGKRINHDFNKNHNHDFILWKQTTIGQNWNSPWGFGRPGWHTECAFFINKYFNDQVTIHGGGIDLIFPHHENERIQLWALKQQEPVKFWLHNGHLFSGAIKMSKSLKNTILVKEFLQKYDHNVLKCLLTTTHYTKPLNVNEKTLQQAVDKVARIEQLLKTSFMQAFLNGENDDFKENKPLITTVLNCLQNDLNFANSWEIIEKLIKNINNSLNNKKIAILPLIKTLQSCLLFLGMEFPIPIYNDEIKELINKWNQARHEQDYELADKIRKNLQIKKIL